MIFDIKCSKTVVLPVSADRYDVLVSAVVDGLDGIRPIDRSTAYFTLEGYSYLSQVGVNCQHTFEGVCALVGSEGRISLTLHTGGGISDFFIKGCAPTLTETATSTPASKPRPLSPSRMASHVSEVVHHAHTLMANSPVRTDRLSPSRTRLRSASPETNQSLPVESNLNEPTVRVRFPGESKSVTVAIPEKLRDMWRRVAEGTQYLYTRGSHRMAAVQGDGVGMEVDIDDDDDLATVANMVRNSTGDVYIQLVDACREGARLQKKRTMIRTVVSPLRNISNVSMTAQVD